jgi:hypothetical protein
MSAALSIYASRFLLAFLAATGRRAFFAFFPHEAHSTAHRGKPIKDPYIELESFSRSVKSQYR